MAELAENQLVKQIRGVLREALSMFRDRPFGDMREGDPQALIFSRLRSVVTPSDVSLELKQRRAAAHTYVGSPRTNRVHRELKLHDEWRLDIAVFRDDVVVEMNVHGNGPLDILATVRGDQLAAVIEIKAAPSKNMWGAYRDDLAKLGMITYAYPQCRGYFIGFDKSLSLAGIRSTIMPSFAWLDALREDPAGRVEAHWLSAEGEPCFRRGRVETE